MPSAARCLEPRHQSAQGAPVIRNLSDGAHAQRRMAPASSSRGAPPRGRPVATEESGPGRTCAGAPLRRIEFERWSPCPAGGDDRSKARGYPTCETRKQPYAFLGFIWEIGQDMRPIFLESEKRPHVKEINEGFSVPPADGARDFGTLGGEPSEILIHDVKHQADGGDSIDENIVRTT